MKTKLILLFSAMLVLSGTVTASNALTMANLTISPNPVVAGGHVAVKFRLYNSYGFWLYSMALQASGSYPLINFSPASGYQIGQLNPGLNLTYFNYSFSIPNTTPAGVYTIYFNATYYAIGSAGAALGTSSMPVTFFVQNKPAIKITASSPQPSALYSGYNQSLQLVIQNNGYGTARNVSVEIAPVQGLTILSSVTSFFIPNLTRGSSVSEPILVAAQGAGQAGIAASATYYSSTLSQRYSSYQRVNLSVAPSAQFTVVSQSGSPGIGATDVPVKYQITNTGTSGAQQVRLSLQTSYPVTPVASTYYISDLQPGASANVTFLVNVDSSGAAGSYPVTLYEQWKQPNGAVNQQFSGSNNYSIAVGGASNSIPLIIGAIIVVIAAAAAYRWRRHTAKPNPRQKNR